MVERERIETYNSGYLLPSEFLVVPCEMIKLSLVR